MSDSSQYLERLFGLDDKVVIVTGASSGLGAHFVEILAAAGATVVATARRANRLDDISKRFAHVTGIAADVTSRTDMERVVNETISHFGRIDVLVNNAGAINVSPAETEEEQDFQRVVNVNLIGTFLASKLTALHMLNAGGGSIVNIASILGLVGNGKIPQAGYAASKGGIINLTRELAAQWASRNVRVNALAPGWFPSEMTLDMLRSESGSEWVKRHTPMQRSGELFELDGALLLLASGASTYITGQVISVDGGWTAV